jgi:N utilization substance protein B
MNKRSKAREYAVQAAYQWLMQGGAVKPILEEFIIHRLHTTEQPESSVDKAYFAALLKGLETRFDDVKALIEARLDASWTLARMDNVLQAICFLGVLELLDQPDTPTKVIINEYIIIAKSYYDDKEPAFVNKLLDTIAKEVRVA